MSAFPLPDNSTQGQFHGDVCPAGHYCPKGSEKPSPCSPGTKEEHIPRRLREELACIKRLFDVDKFVRQICGSTKRL